MAPPLGTIVLILALQVIALSVMLDRLDTLGWVDKRKLLDVSTYTSYLGSSHPCGSLHASHFAVVSNNLVFPDGRASGAVVVRSGKVHWTVRLPDVADASGPESTSEHITALKAQLGVKTILNFGDLYVSPGVIDTHVHMDEPGRTEWEGMETGTLAAAAGGITTVVDMPLNNYPCTTTGELLQTKLKAAKGKLHVDVGFWGGIVPDNAANHSVLQDMLDGGALGFKSFMSPSGINDFPNVGRKDIEAAMPFVKAQGVPHYLHAEVLQDIDPKGDPTKYATFLATRPRQFEKDAILMLLDILAKDQKRPSQPGFRFHVAHLSNADMLPNLAAARSKGLPITVETCPHYLSFTAEAIPDRATQFKCMPPIREAENQERLIKGLKDGVIDSVASDHSPSTPDLKKFDTGDFLEAWGGIAGVQYSLPAVWTSLQKRGLQPEALAKWWSEGPAAIAGLSHRKGRIAEGMDADFVVWDPKATADTSAQGLRTRHKFSPYRDMPLVGRVVATFVRGQQVFSNVTGPVTQHCGQTLLRGHNL